MRILRASLLALVVAETVVICMLIYNIKTKVNEINVEVDNMADASEKLNEDTDKLIKEIDELNASNKILYEKVVQRQKELDEQSRQLDLIEQKNKNESKRIRQQ